MRSWKRRIIVSFDECHEGDEDDSSDEEDPTFEVPIQIRNCKNKELGRVCCSRHIQILNQPTVYWLAVQNSWLLHAIVL